MPSTRSSSRRDTNSSPASVKSVAGNKRKADGAADSKAPKRGKSAKGQLTLEETVEDKVANTPQADSTAEKKHVNGNGDTNGHVEKSTEAKTGIAAQEEMLAEAKDSLAAQEKELAEAKAEQTAEDKQADTTNNQQNGQADTDVEMADAQADAGAESSAFDKVKAQEGEAGTTTKEQTSDETKQETDQSTTSGAIEEDKQREASMPSNILEKGIIYFFTRGRVGTDDPDSVQDLARSYFVLRPLAAGAKITEGSIQDAKVSRLLALPKKVWPKSGRDKFMVFVEKANADMKDLKEEFFQGSEYSTKTVGTRQTPPVTPVGEGVYAITTTGGGQGTSHLAYMLTIPSTVGEVQKDLGLAGKGSFVLSLKNPEASGPANAALPEKPDWPKEYIEEFSGRSWMPVHPKHLDYANAQMLLIGEDFESSNNLEAKPQDEKDENKETPAEELNKLEEEDEHRVEALKGDDSIFADLGLSSKDYPKVMTTW